MTELEIKKLYFDRNEKAVSVTAKTFGGQLKAIALNILNNREDAEECVADTYKRAWDSIPPADPQSLCAYLSKTVRNLALDRCDKKSAKKRGEGKQEAVFDELAECIPHTETGFEEVELTEILNAFLKNLDQTERKVFLQRYWYFCKIREISKNCDMGESRVKMILLRTRNELKAHLEKEGIFL